MQYLVQIERRKHAHSEWVTIDKEQSEFCAIPMAKDIHTETGDRVRVASRPKHGGTAHHNVLWASWRKPKDCRK